MAAPPSSNVENLHPHIVRRVMREVTELSQDPPEGVKVILNEDDITDIQATIEGPVGGATGDETRRCPRKRLGGTPYEGGLFKMKLVLPKEFPASPPQGFFLTKIFHPNVASNGAICVNTLKRDWKPDHGIRHILLTIKCLLIYPNPESALNEEAGRLLLEHYDDYSSRARMMTTIHAKLSRGEAAGSVSDVTSKKRPLDSASSGLEKKKKDKKKALKRL